ncbi:hypothetical protein [Aquisalibacillus elongatus]|uniref:Uncharacterized protein n=1 Tax=Aquisalibacillus elongatus TaxID=485577 RepID=A0A3N5BCU2_9BACI|nr:hypothetical protein [Aquisalibacillus elongatus]RPF55444.1 hypothetical protein EDC24_0321 [Aquisalibacillus elongatus]
MAKLSELVNVNRDTIKIQGVDISIIFTFISFPYVEETYGKPDEVTMYVSVDAKGAL